MMLGALMLAPHFNGVYGPEKMYAAYDGPGTID
jgi:hypothetical protein